MDKLVFCRKFILTNQLFTMHIVMLSIFDIIATCLIFRTKELSQPESKCHSRMLLAHLFILFKERATVAQPYPSDAKHINLDI